MNVHRSEIFAQILGLEASEYTLKQKLKIVALITDLLAEQEAAEMESNQETVVGIVNTVSHDRLRQYREIPLRDELRLKGCCGLVARMLPMTSEYDSQEKVLNALHLMTPHCGKEFPSGVRDSVYHLKSIYEAELKKNDPDLVEYLRHLLKIVNDLIEQLPNISHHDERKAEL